ncbi:MAG TPA: acyl-CoA dehydrogenase [Acidimicrobiales bacterium]|nr:acyl-CoA dehydrogenase [Acidimicrobiales bacterium]
MELSPSPEGQVLLEQVREFMAEHIYPNEDTFREQIKEAGSPHAFPPILEELKAKAHDKGLWNMFLPHLNPDEPGTRLSNVDYAYVAEELGKVSFASEVFNCAAPDTGNMELLHLFGTPEQKERWLYPLLESEIRSSFAMTEPDVASSDATNIQTSMVREGDEYVINGRKWFISGAEGERCKVLIVMGKTDPEASRHRQQSMILVPRDHPGVEIVRTMKVFGYEDRGGHPEIRFDNCRVPVDNLLGEEGGGFAMSQARLGPGRIHHCMRSIGVAERALGLMVDRALVRVPFGKPVAQQSVIQNWIAEARIEIDQVRLLCLKAAYMMDTVGNRGAATEISAIKVAAPNVSLKVLDRAIQVHGAMGVSQDTPLANMYAHQRTLRLADGPDEVHKMTIARREIKKHDPDFRMT